MPKELIGTGVGKIEWRDYDEPKLAVGQVRVRSEFGAAKHGTEMAGYKGYASHRGRFDRDLNVFTMQPGPAGRFMVGNMTVGTVIEVAAEVKSPAVGDRVLVYGGFRQTHVVPLSDCWKIGKDVNWKSAVCLDPADFAFAAVRDGHVRVGDVVAVFGMGAIGLMAVQIAKVAGASHVTAVDPIALRRKIAAQCGADAALDPSACDAGLEIKKATGGRGADVVIEYSGSRQALQASLRAVAYGGNVVCGAYPPVYGAGLDFGAEAHLNIPNIIFTRACSQPDRDNPRWNQKRIMDECLRLLSCGRLNGEHVVTPVVPFERAAEEYPKIATSPDAYVKLGVEY